jgi:hypothetical protein
MPPAVDRGSYLAINLRVAEKRAPLAEAIVAIACLQTPTNDKYVVRGAVVFY